MPSTKTITPLIAGRYYHIFNRGINRQNIFFQNRNYQFFLSLLNKYLIEYIEILAYCLLPNHFHLLIQLKEVITINSKNQNDLVEIQNENEIGEFVSEQFRRMFISYSQTINRQENRNGSLFVRNFKRIELKDDEHLKYLYFYIHFNPQKHGIITDFTNYKYSSFQAYLSSQKTKISKNHGLQFFDGLDSFIQYHEFLHEEKEDLILE